MKKILYVTNITRNINSFFIPHLNMLIDQGYIVDCACKITGEHRINKEKLKGNINFFDIPVTRNPLSIKNIKALYMLYKIQKENKYDIIHVHSPIIGAYTRLLKLFYPSLKMIYTAHGYHFHKNSSKLSWIVFYNIEKYLAKYTDVLITINNEDFNISKDFKCGKLIKMNGVGVDLSEFKEISNVKKNKIRESLNLENDDFVIIMVGEHNKNKNQIQLIKAMQILEKDYPKIKAIFIGDGELIEKNKKYIKKNNIKNSMILGFRKDVNDLINVSDVICSLSYREGLPRNILEGMICKKIVLGSNIRGVTDLVDNESNGYIVENTNLMEIVCKIRKIYNLDEKKKYTMQKKSFEKAMDYEIDKILEHLKTIY
ncbi:TPA: glycosyltransferase [Clostridium perfringens]